MCFQIPAKQTPWKNRVVYKWVGRNYKGPHYPVKGQIFKPGRTVVATNVRGRVAIGPVPFGVGVLFAVKSCGQLKAMSGIYVYKTLTAALRDMRNGYLLACAVSPADFKFHAWSHHATATYTKVTVLKVVKTR